MDYVFFVGNTFSHRGVIAFQLFDVGEAWTIVQITDPRRTDRCAQQ